MSSLQGLLERIVPALHSAGVPFMVAGSFASAAHGLPRSTNDLDIIIDPTREALDSLLAKLDTILAKLEWSKASGGSERQRRDIAGVIATLGDSLDQIYLEHWLRELDLESEWAIAQQTPIA